MTHEERVLAEQALADARIVDESTQPSGTLYDRLSYQVRVNQILTTQGDRGSSVYPAVLTKGEMRELEEFYESGETPEDFAKVIMDKDNRAQAKAADLNPDNGGSSDTHYRESMRDAGRSHLLR